MSATTTTLSRPRRGLALTAVGAAVLVGVAACGSGTATKSAPAAFVGGVAKLDAGNQLSVTLKVDATAAQLVALDRADASPDSSPLTLQDAQLITGGSLVLQAVSAGSSFAADEKGGAAATAGEKVAVAVNSSGTPNLVQLVVIDKTIYARADVKTIAGYSGDASKLQQLAGSGQIPPSFSFVTDAIAGKWIKIDEQSLTSSLKAVSPGATPSVAPSQAAALRSAVLGVFTKDVTATRDGKNSSHLILTGDSKVVSTDLIAAVKANAADIPGASALLAKADASKVPSKTITLDAYLDGDALSSLKLDLTQLFTPTEKAAVTGTPVEVELDFARTATVAAPANATTVPNDAFSGLLGSLGSTGA